MQINFNDLRKNILSDYNNLVKKLNGSIVEDTDMNRIIIPIEDLQKTLDSLRMKLCLLASLFEKDNNDCQELAMFVEIFNPHEY